MTEDSILGYDLYSSALAEILSEPSLHTPITVGLYAKWGSGKSFLLSQLKSEMKSFARLTRVVNLKLNITSILAIIVINLLFAVPLGIWQWPFGIVLFFSLNVLTFFLIGIFNLFLFNSDVT
jgi:ankyrin repeat-rich membrane spanning protein